MAGYFEVLTIQKNRLVTLVALLACAFFSCGFFFSDPADTVKDGYMDFDKSTTVGAALQNYEYIKSSKWSVLEDKQKRKIVQFEGVIDQEKMARSLLNSNQRHSLAPYGLHEPAKLQAAIGNKNNMMHTSIWKLLIQFRIEKDGKFSLAYIGSVAPSGENIPLYLDMLYLVYQNEIMMMPGMGQAWGK